MATIRDNLLYRLRRKGIEADTRQRLIFIPCGVAPELFPQIIRLCNEFYFNVQFTIACPLQ